MSATPSKSITGTEAGVPIQPVVTAEDKTRIGEFLGEAPPDLRTQLGQVDFIHLDRSRPAHWGTGIAAVLKRFSWHPPSRV